MLIARAMSSRLSHILSNSRSTEILTSVRPRGGPSGRVLMEPLSINWTIRGLSSIISPIRPSKNVSFIGLVSVQNILYHRYWSVKRMELKAMLENCGPFHIFFTLSCGDKR